jgi:hypothetical protein
MDTVRSELAKAVGALNDSEMNMSNYTEDEVVNLNNASTVAWWAIREAIKALDVHDNEIEQRLISRLTAAWKGPPEQLQYYIAKMKEVE